MGQPRASRRKTVVVSSDEEDVPAAATITTLSSEDEESLKPQKRSNGKLKPVKKAAKAHPSTPATSTQDGSSQKSPAKPKASKTKSRTAVKDQPKQNARSIYSFFNATTERLQLSQPSASPEKLATQDEPEGINDDFGDDGSSITLSKSSNVALAMRKRKVQPSQSFEEAELPPPATQKFRKTNDGGRAPSLLVMNEDKRPWIEQFAPVDLSELAVHKRKVADVRQWLDVAINGARRKVLVLKGAAGTGKTTTLRLLAPELGVHVCEWRNPAGADLTSEGSLSNTEQFEEFIRIAGKSAGLTLVSGTNASTKPVGVPVFDDPGTGDNRKQLLLIEEFPNTFSRSSTALQSFRSTILQYVSSPPITYESATPIVMVISETLLSTNTAAADSFTAHRLLGPELVNHPYVNMIEFNPVATTFLTKALETIVVKEARKSGRRKTPGPRVLKHLAETGDVRSAVSSLEFLCLRGDDGDTWSSKVSFAKSKKAKVEPAMTKAEEDVLKLITNRESTLGIFHAVGRVVYNKRTEAAPGLTLAQPPPWLPQHRRMKAPEADVDSLIDELGTDTPTFLAALHENYALSCSCSSAEDTLDSLSGSIDNISDADLLSVDRFSFGTRAFSGSATDSLRQDEMSFQIAVRGVLFGLPSPVHRSAVAGSNKADAHRMFYPASLKIWKAKEEIESMLDLLTARLQNHELDNAPYRRIGGGITDGGIESWKRKTGFKGASKESERKTEDTAAVHLSTLTKKEALLERLPYMAYIQSARQSPTASTAILDQIQIVTQVRGQAAISEADEDAAEEELDAAAMPEQWSTDKPDSELQSGKKQSSAQRRGKREVETEGGGLMIPVESRVEKLVLEDDDIVDD
ncbi:hypothetical protein LTR08_001833 [Meristemomyces frigidus]|nr:hypothetical protein LTR08_001833 [Meristemomyces frigidus]